MSLDISRPSRAFARLSRRRPAVERYLFGVPVLLVLWISITILSGREPIERAGAIRLWTIYGSAIMTIALPHLLFPRRHFRDFLLVAPPRSAVFVDTFRRAFPLFVVVAVPALAGAAFDGSLMESAMTVAILLAVWILSVSRFTRLGSVSQAWQEGRRGAWYRRANEHISVPMPLPAGSLPVLLTTSALFAAALAAVVLAAAIPGGVLRWLVPVVFLAVAMADAVRLLSSADAEAYCSQAFFDELMRMYGGIREETREVISFEAVYWVPQGVRAATWAQLVQLDRRLPLGRMVFVGHLIFWILIFNQGYGAAAIGYLLLFSVAKNAAPGILTSSDGSPPAFNLTLQPASNWFLTRAFVSLRWSLPWALSLGVVATFSSSFTALSAAIWLAADVALAFIGAALVTLLIEYRHRKALA